MPPLGDDSDDDGFDPFAAAHNNRSKIFEANPITSLEVEARRKQREKQVDPFGVTPGYREASKRTVTRFIQFRVETLHKQPRDPFTVIDIIDFIDNVRDRLILPYGKEVPAFKTLVNLWKSIYLWATFQFPGFEVTRHERAQVKAYFDTLKRKNQVVLGIWNARVWLSFNTISRMLRSWFEHHVDRGTMSWDQVIARALSIAMVSALGCRAGDVALTAGYKHECLRYNKVKITLVDSAPLDPEKLDISMLEMAVELHYTKGKKKDMNEPLIHYMQPLSADCAHICAVRLLLVHALRHGLVVGSTLAEVLADTSTRPGRQLAWTQPTYPVLAAFSDRNKIDLAKPAIRDQLLQSINHIAIVSNIMSRVYVHALRYGFARDIAHMKCDGEGASTETARLSMGHSKGAKHTDDYIGGLSTLLANRREENRGVRHRRDPKFAGPETKALDLFDKPVTEKEVSTWLAKYQSRPKYKGKLTQADLSESQVKHVRRMVREDRLREFHEGARPETASTKRSREMGTVLLPLDSNAPRPAKRLMTSKDQTSGSTSENTPPANADDPERPISNSIDPALLNEQDAGPPVDRRLPAVLNAGPSVDPKAPEIRGVVDSVLPDSSKNGGTVDRRVPAPQNVGPTINPQASGTGGVVDPVLHDTSKGSSAVDRRLPASLCIGPAADPRAPDTRRVVDPVPRDTSKGGSAVDRSLPASLEIGPAADPRALGTRSVVDPVLRDGSKNGTAGGRHLHAPLDPGAAVDPRTSEAAAVIDRAPRVSSSAGSAVDRQLGTSHTSQNRQKAHPYFNLDRANVEDEEALDAVDLPEEVSQSLEYVLLPQELDPVSEEQDENPGESTVDSTDNLFATDFDQTDPIDQEGLRNALPPSEGHDEEQQRDFVSTFAKINVVKCRGFGMEYKRNNLEYRPSMAPFASTGNSRDRPTGWLYKCEKTPGCTFTAWEPVAIYSHEVSCSPDRVQKLLDLDSQKTHHCPYEDCSTVIHGDATLLRRHIEYEHLFEPQQCDFPDCPNERWFDRKSHLDSHKSTHNPDFPIKCSHIDCAESQKTYKRMQTLRYHLEHSHGLTTAAAKKPYEPVSSKPPRRRWVPADCPLDPCEKHCKERKQMKDHIIKVHEKSEDEAEALVAAMY